MTKYKIDIEKNYSFPLDIRIIKYRGDILVISRLTANWVVLHTQEQLNILHALSEGKSIKEIIDSQSFNNQDINYVVLQIEAKRFCSKIVHSSTEESRSLHLYLTNECNLGCPHCYMFSGKQSKNELTTEEVIRLLQDYKNLANGKRITLSGGEPSIRIDFDLIVRTAASLGLEVKVLTNGALFTRDRVKSLSNYIHNVQVSIDGFSEESNAKIRGKGHFAKAIDAVDAFIENGIETSIAVTPSLELLQNYSANYITFARELLSKYNGKPFIIKFAEGLSEGRTINPSDSFNNEYAALVKHIQNEIFSDQYDLITFVRTMREDIILDNCMFGVFSVSSVGDVYLCPEIGKLLPIANIRTTSFIDIIKKSRIAENATMISQLHPCSECELMYICGGGCRTKEFPELVKRSSFVDIDYSTIPPRNCTQNNKENFYRLMIESNEYLFKPIE